MDFIRAAKNWYKLISFINGQRKEGKYAFKIVTNGIVIVFYDEKSDLSKDLLRIEYLHNK